MRCELDNLKHKFIKQNLVSIAGRKGYYDILKCKCGLTGNSYALGTIDFRSNVKIKKVETQCEFYVGLKEEGYIGREIKSLVNGSNIGTPFKNIIIGGEYKVIMPPEGFVNGDKGVWIMGVGEPVKLLFREFEFINDLLGEGKN